MLRLLLAVALIGTQLRADEFVPPVPKGVKGDRALQQRPVPLPSPKQKWVRVESPRFTVISSGDEVEARDVAANLETLADALARVDHRFAASGSKTRVLFFRRRSDSQPYFNLLLNDEASRAPGLFVSTTDGHGTMVIDGTRAFTERIVFHELVHNLLSNSGARLPLWLEEGIAEYFSTAQIRRDSLILGGPIREHLSQFRNRSPIPPLDLFAVTFDRPEATWGFFYASSWVVVDWMLRSDREAFYRFVADVDGGMSSAEAMEKHFNVQPKGLERLVSLRMFGPAQTVTVRVGDVQRPVTSEAISHAEALYELGRFLSSLDVSRADGERHLRAAMEADPKHARAVAALGTSYAREKRYGDALPMFEKALAIAPDDPLVLVDFAEALLQNEIGQFAGTVEPGRDAPDRARRARDLAHRALRAGGDAARAHAAVGASYLVEADVKPGIAALEEARRLAPARVDVALNLYALYLRGGEAAKAEKLFTEAFDKARDPQVVFAARSLFVRERLVTANTLVKEQKIDEAIALIDELIAVTPDPVGKTSLIEQKRSLAGVRDVNHEINTYNKAVAHANKREKAAALKTLRELLQFAKDPDVIEDAKALEKWLTRHDKKK